MNILLLTVIGSFIMGITSLNLLPVPGNRHVVIAHISAAFFIILCLSCLLYALDFRATQLRSVITNINFHQDKVKAVYSIDPSNVSSVSRNNHKWLDRMQAAILSAILRTVHKGRQLGGKKKGGGGRWKVDKTWHWVRGGGGEGGGVPYKVNINHDALKGWGKEKPKWRKTFFFFYFWTTLPWAEFVTN